MKQFYLVVLIILAFSGTAQSQNTQEKCKLNVNDLILGKIKVNDALKKCKNDTLEVIVSITNSINDSSTFESYQTLNSAILQLSKRTSNSVFQNNTINFYLKNLSNRNSSIANQAINRLKKFSKSDFDSTSIKIIEQYINVNYTAYKDLILLAGYVGNHRTSEKIKDVFPNGRNFSKPELWATYIALARLGDESSIQYCKARVESLPLNDQVVDILYKDLVYTRKKTAYDLMVKSIYSDEKLCTSSNPNSDAKIICGYRVLELVAPYIEKFPIKVLESGDLATDNYPKALEIAREWFQNNKDSYIIVNENY